MMALPAIPPADARRIVASMARLRSPHDGEVVAAARAVGRLLAPHGVYVEALAAAAFAAPDSADERRSRPQPRSHSEAANWCLEASYWSARERDFLATATWLPKLSAKQADWLDRLCARRGREA